MTRNSINARNEISTIKRKKHIYFKSWKSEIKMHLWGKKYLKPWEPEFPENRQLYTILLQTRTRSNGDLGDSYTSENRIRTEDTIGITT